MSPVSCSGLLGSVGWSPDVAGVVEWATWFSQLVTRCRWCRGMGYLVQSVGHIGTVLENFHLFLSLPKLVTLPMQHEQPHVCHFSAFVLWKTV